MDNYERVFAKSAELAYYLEYRMLDAEYRAPANPGQCGPPFLTVPEYSLVSFGVENRARLTRN